MSYSPTYTTITAIEIQELARLKASGCTWAIVSCLNAYAQGKHTCFPSIQTISEFLGGSYTTRAIHKALRWLEQHNLIQRNERQSKKRFVLKLRALAHQGIEAVKRTIVPNKANNRSLEKNQENNHYFCNDKRTHSSSIRSKSRSIWAKKRAKNRVGGNWGLPDYEPDKRPQIEKDCDRILTFYFTSGGTHEWTQEERNTFELRWSTDADWRSWMKEHNQRVCQLLGLH